jgi:hypothetical protein
MATTINVEKELKKLGLKLLDLDKRDQKILSLKYVTLAQIESLKKLLEKLDKPLILGSSRSHSSVELISGLNENTQLGDAIETILRVKGPLFRKEIIDWLRRYRVRISLKAPQQVLANAIKKDKKRRFETLEDGRVALKK